MAFGFSSRSRANLATVHPLLRRVAEEAIANSKVDFMVTEGRRAPERQKALVKSGASRTMKSKHLTGHAIDVAPIVNGVARWDWPLFHLIADAMKAAAKAQGVKLTWGGNWRSFKDGPHFEIDPKTYP